MTRKPVAFLALALAVLLAGAPAFAREIVDMAGNRVQVPDEVARVYGASPPDEMLLYAVDPQLIAAQHNRSQPSPYVDPLLQKLPVVTGFVRAAPVNVEAITRLKPDAVILWDESPDQENFLKTMAAAHIPVLVTKHRTYDDIVAGILMVGELTNHQARAQALADYARKTAREVQAAVGPIPEAQRLKVYLNDNADDGLQSRCDTSMHAEILKFAGARVVPDCKAVSIIVNAELSFEQLLAYDPDVILTNSTTFLHATKTDPKWRLLKAVRTGRVYLMPKTPFSWITRPPSFMRILAAKWVASVLYPARYKPDMVKETENFYRLFLKTNLNDAQARAILQGD